VEAANRDLDAGSSQVPGYVHRTWKLVRLDTNKADEANIPVALEASNYSPNRDRYVGFVARFSIDLDVVAEHPPSGCIESQAV
jgi:hypothetical protein